jgi:hypothetical protein
MESECIDSGFLDLGTSLKVNGQLHAQAALHPAKNSRHPLDRWLSTCQKIKVFAIRGITTQNNMTNKNNRNNK